MVDNTDSLDALLAGQNHTQHVPTGRELRKEYEGFKSIYHDDYKDGSTSYVTRGIIPRCT